MDKQLYNTSWAYQLYIDTGKDLSGVTPEDIRKGKVSPTIEQKYNYLLSLLEIEDVDLFEKDACIGMPKRVYFQFNEYDVVGMSVEDVLNELLREKT